MLLCRCWGFQQEVVDFPPRAMLGRYLIIKYFNYMPEKLYGSLENAPVQITIFMLYCPFVDCIDLNGCVDSFHRLPNFSNHGGPIHAPFHIVSI